MARLFDPILVEVISVKWSWYHPADDGGKVVWALLRHGGDVNVDGRAMT